MVALKERNVFNHIPTMWSHIEDTLQFGMSLDYFTDIFCFLHVSHRLVLLFRDVFFGQRLAPGELVKGMTCTQITPSILFEGFEVHKL